MRIKSNEVDLSTLSHFFLFAGDNPDVAGYNSIARPVGTVEELRSAVRVEACISYETHFSVSFLASENSLETLWVVALPASVGNSQSWRPRNGNFEVFEWRLYCRLEEAAVEGAAGGVAAMLRPGGMAPSTHSWQARLKARLYTGPHLLKRILWRWLAMTATPSKLG